MTILILLSIELISKCADYLIVKATKKDDMMMWKPQIASNALAGYSHGAAGIALALIKAGEMKELYYPTIFLMNPYSAL